MPLPPGSQLGPYEIVAPLGAGGMGEVYRARDPRLGREVALKVLPAELANDAGRRARFEQEARAVAALNHPNVVAIHDVGEGYIVSELVVGETLTDIIQRGPVPARRLIDLAVQMADGVSAAHAAHITHRDLKPANIMVTGEGRVKILDFGLAKQSVFAAGAPDETVTVAQTTPGMILGTVHYMSPEQARGTPADHRSDQFSLGLIFYEMATGRKAFDGASVVETMAAILKEDAPPLETPLPAPLRWAIERCLAKDPAERYESTRDLYHDLRNVRDHLTEASPAATTPVAPAKATAVRRPVGRKIAAAIAGLAALAGAFAAGWSFSGPRLPDQSAYRFLPFAFDQGIQSNPVWSPDGKAVAYASAPVNAGVQQVFVRYLDSPVPAQVTRIAEDARPIAWAPDGRRILFRSSRKPAGVWSISTTGGEPEPVLAFDSGLPVTIAPDMKAAAFLRRGDDGIHSVWISSPLGAPAERYVPDAIASRALFNSPRLAFSPDGKWLLAWAKRDRNREEAWLMPYPPNTSTPPRRVLADLHSFAGTPTFSWWPDSRHIVAVVQSDPGSPTELWLADTRSDRRIVLTAGTAGQGAVAVSPDGNRAVFTEHPDNLDVVSVDLEHATVQRLIATDRDDYMPAWAPKQPLLVYATTRNGPPEIWLHSVTAGDRPLVTSRDFPAETTQWFAAPMLSPDADRVIYGRTDVEGRSQIWISAVSGGAPVPLTNDTDAAEFSGSWSPDGSWIAYLATRKGERDLLKVKSSGQATPVVVRPGIGATEVPVWSPNGDWILCGNDLVSPDGASVRSLGNHGSATYAFSQDGKLLYGLRNAGNQELLFSLNIASGAEHVIGDVGPNNQPGGGLHPGWRFSLSPDGKMMTYGAGYDKSNLWLMEGLSKALKPAGF